MTDDTNSVDMVKLRYGPAAFALTMVACGWAASSAVIATPSASAVFIGGPLIAFANTKHGRARSPEPTLTPLGILVIFAWMSARSDSRSVTSGKARGRIASTKSVI